MVETLKTSDTAAASIFTMRGRMSQMHENTEINQKQWLPEKKKKKGSHSKNLEMVRL